MTMRATVAETHAASSRKTSLTLTRRRREEIPDDVSVVGYDDSLFMTCTDPPLTTVRQPIEAMGQAVVALLVNEISGNEVPGEEMGVTFYVGTVSEYDSGKKAGDRLGKEGVLKVICINHEVGNTSLDDRCRGLNDGLAPHGGGTEVVAVTPDPGDITRRTEAYLSAHPDVQGVFAMGAGAATPLIPMFKEKELFGKIKLYTFDIAPEVLDSIIAGEMEFGMDAQQYLMGFVPVVMMVEHVTHGFWPQNDVYTGPLFVDTPEAAQAILALAKEGIR